MTTDTRADLVRIAKAALRRSEQAYAASDHIASSVATVAAQWAHVGRTLSPDFYDQHIVARAARIEAYVECVELHALAGT